MLIFPNLVDDSAGDITTDPNYRIEDTISAIIWAQNTPNVIATSQWDGKIKVYEII